MTCKLCVLFIQEQQTQNHSMKLPLLDEMTSDGFEHADFRMMPEVSQKSIGICLVYTSGCR